MFSFGVVLTILLNLALKDQPPWVFLTVIMVIQIIMSRISLSLPRLRPDIPNISDDESLL